jgi:tRNA 2-thiocytidine biosynthesis protein TtcA
MQAHYLNDEGDLRVIRPLVYVRERQTSAFARSASLPVISENCPACFARPTERFHMKQLLATLEGQHPRLFNSLRTALRPLMGAVPGASKGNVTCATAAAGSAVTGGTQQPGAFD